jgi:hypothetical protein
MNIPGFFAGLAISSGSYVTTAGKSYERGISKKNVILSQQQSGGEQCDNTVNTCCSNATESCRCKSPMACLDFYNTCRKNGYNNFDCNKNMCTCYASFTRGMSGVGGPTGGLLSQ